MPASMQAPELPPTEPLGSGVLMTRLRGSQGLRAGVVLGVATLVLNGCAYLYNVACIRYLGPRVYGDVAAMLALFALVSLPLGSIQSLLAREVAQLSSSGAIRALLRRATVIAVVFGLASVALAAALVQPIRELLNVQSSSAVLAGIGAVFFAVVAVVLYGFLQGLLRFHALGLTYALSGLSRLILVIPALLLGFGATGALLVNTFASFVAVAVAAIALHRLWRLKTSEKAPHLDRPQGVVLLIGSLAFASLTNVDILLAAYFFSDHLVGIYAAAALAGKIVLFLPAAIVTVLLPKAATRAAAGITSAPILLASLAVTLVITLATAALLALVPESLLVWAFGGDFRESTALLGWFGLAMTAAALVSVYLSVYFAERDARFPLLVLGAAIAQIVVICLWHPNLRSIVLVTLACFSSVLLIHEIAFPYALRRVWRRRRRV
jgi:O-antigen/teichoic acid export membrane protein